MRQHRQPEPEIRSGICCGEGCGEFDVLYKVPGIYRYRCDRCFKAEQGYRHPLASPLTEAILRERERES